MKLLDFLLLPTSSYYYYVATKKLKATKNRTKTYICLADSGNLVALTSLLTCGRLSLDGILLWSCLTSAATDFGHMLTSRFLETPSGDRIGPYGCAYPTTTTTTVLLVVEVTLTGTRPPSYPYRVNRLYTDCIMLRADSLPSKATLRTRTGCYECKTRGSLSETLG